MAAVVPLLQPGVPQAVQPPVAASPPHPPRNFSSIKGLAITQLVIGVLTGIFGIADYARLYDINWTASSGTGIWAGGWITMTGIVGVCYYRNWQSTSLNGVYMALSIISTVASGLAGLFFIISVIFYAVLDGCVVKGGWSMDDDDHNDCVTVKSVGLGLHVPLLIMMVLEFFVSIVAAAFCCQNGCCQQRTQGAIIVQPAGQGMVMQGAYPQQYPGQAVPQYWVAPQYGNAPQYGVQVPQYSTQVAPPFNPHPGYPQYHSQVDAASTEKPLAYQQQ